MSTTSKRKFEITSASLHVMAMLFMLCDHIWGIGIPGNDWLTCVGRLAFPIFAFMIVEGYFHTKNFKKYLLRLLIFALISEIPFNLMMGSRLFYPIHQNVLWSFLISLLLVHWNEKTKKRGKWYLSLLVAVASVLLAIPLGIVTFVDFYQAGILTVLAFYFFRGNKWWCYVGQLAALYYINVEMLQGLSYEIVLFDQTHFFVRQGLALLALIPIWLYRGSQGHHSKAFRYFCYAFYPAHILLLYVVKIIFLS